MPIEASRTLVEHLLEFFGLLLIESRMDGARSARAFAKRLFEALLVELGDDVSGGPIVAPEDPGDLVGVFAIGAGKQDLATAQGEGIPGRAQTRLQGLTLDITQGTHEDRSFHASEDKLLPAISSAPALGGRGWLENACRWRWL